MQGANWIGFGDFSRQAAPWEGHPGGSCRYKASLCAAALLLASSAVQAGKAASFFVRKTITITIGYSAGGSYDLYGRMIARHLGRDGNGQR